MATEDIRVIEALVTYINSIPGLLSTVELEYLSEDPPAMMLQQLKGASKYNEDILGNYEAQLPFALYVRTHGLSQENRIDAVEVLNDIGAYFDVQTNNKNLPDLGDNKTTTAITMTSTPSLFARDEDGTEDYQATYRIEYEQNNE